MFGYTAEQITAHKGVEMTTVRISGEAARNWVEAYRLAGGNKMTTKYTQKEALIINKAIQDFINEGFSISYFQGWVKEHTEPELKPCPFCGGPGDVVSWGFVYCNNKMCYLNKTGIPEEQWNKRA